MALRLPTLEHVHNPDACTQFCIPDELPLPSKSSYLSPVPRIAHEVPIMEFSSAVVENQRELS